VHDIACGLLLAIVGFRWQFGASRGQVSLATAGYIALVVIYRSAGQISVGISVAQVLSALARPSWEAPQESSVAELLDEDPVPVPRSGSCSPCSGDAWQR
jgi:hypothetical protein